MAELMNIDWGEHGKECYAINQCEPCCGQPCNVTQGCYCFWCFACCSPCVLAKLWATSLGQDCGFINHFLPWIIFYLITLALSVATSIMSPFLFGSSVAFILSILHLISGVCSILYLVTYIILRTATRVNLRRMWNIGEPAPNICDVFLVCCCCTSICELCQELRSVNISGWDWLGQLRTKGFLSSTGGFQLFRDSSAPAPHFEHKEGFQGSYQQPPSAGYYAPSHQPAMKEENYY